MRTNNQLSEVLDTIEDRGKALGLIPEMIIDRWGGGLFTRRPAPALCPNGEFQGTDLDLASFLSALVSRRAVICLPEYHRLRPASENAREWVTSPTGRHGHVVGLGSNKAVFTFHIRIQDLNVVRREDDREVIGGFRSFCLTDLTGQWYDGWERIEFLPDRKENAFLTEREIWVDDVATFKNFVHPNRAAAFFGQDYFVLKSLIQRMEEECRHLRVGLVRLREAEGTAEEAVAVVEEAEREETEGGERPPARSVVVPAFEAKVSDCLAGKYPAVQAADEERLRKWQYQLLPRLRFHARATELAFVRHLGPGAAPPRWIKGQWHKQVVKRTEWNLIEIPKLGFLRCRSWEKLERVSERVGGEKGVVS